MMLILLSDRPLHARFQRHILSSSALYHQQSTCAALPSQHLQLLGILCCWPDVLELAAERPTRHWTPRRRFQTISEDVLIFIVLVHSVH